jgi:hypothetical protein
VWYDLYGSAADLKAVFTADIKPAKPSTTTLTCSNSNVFGRLQADEAARAGMEGLARDDYARLSGLTPIRRTDSLSRLG